ncbi:MAG: sulfotransferase [Filomicrobium sp.]|nr:sulfotransferase [Filomicrobium sp.]
MRGWNFIQDKIAEIMRKHPHRLLRIRYEDFVANPENELRKIMEFCGEKFNPQQIQFSTREHHNISGNNMRFSASEIKPNTKYLEQVNFLSWYTATSLTSNTLKKYGYTLSKNGMRKQLSRKNAISAQ